MLLTIDSAGRVLELFDRDRPEHGVTDVAQALDISKSKAHALLSSLTTVGLLRRTERGRYRIGWRVLSLNRVLNETTDFHRFAKPVIQALGARFGEMVHLVTLEEGKAVCVDRIEGTNHIRIAASALGASLPAHASSSGKVLLAQLPPAELDRAIGLHGLPKFAPRTITDRATLDADLERIRRRGFAIEHSEAVADVSCVAAPISVPGPQAVAAISMAAPSFRFQGRKDVYSHAVVRAAKYVTRQLAEAEAQAFLGVPEYANED